MSKKGQVISVNFGDFSVSLEGFDDPFTVMKQVTDYLEARKNQDPDFGKDSLEAEDGLPEEISKALPLEDAELTVKNDLLTLTMAELDARIEAQMPSEKSKAEEDLITQAVSEALALEEEARNTPLALQDPVSAEEMAEVEMTFATERHPRKEAVAPVDLEEHAEETKELPFVGKSVNENREPSRSKIKIIRNDYSSLLEEAEAEIAERNAAEETSETVEAPASESKPQKPKPTFRKLKPMPEAEEAPVAEEPKPANVPYRKLKAN